MTKDELIASARARIGSGESMDAVIGFLRDAGMDVMDSIWILQKTRTKTYAEAKMAVLNSPVWLDIRADVEALHEVLVDYLERQQDD
jgi:hypothetical protein